jgi:glyoxylase-like metal-dependent hydrolase (beta-lactamase superfamily II)
MTNITVPLDLDPGQNAGEVAVLSPLVRRLVAPNPGPMTFKGTCTYIVGHGEVAVIDPGPAAPEHIDAIQKVLARERVTHIMVTHTHRDHSPGARLLKAKTGAPIVGCAPYRPAREPFGPEVAAVAASNDLEHLPDRVLAEGDTVTSPGFTLEALTTPGHTMNHLAFALREEHALFSGDHVMAWSTTVISPPTGSMSAYMQSLEKLRQRDDRVYWPGHGGPVGDPQRFVRALQHHRRQRERAILERVRRGDRTAQDVVRSIYDGLDPRLERAAALSVLAHLEDLSGRRKVERSGDPGLAGSFRLVG